MAAGKGRKPVVVEGLVYAEPAVVVWPDGERERWLSRAAALEHGREERGWVTAATGADKLSDLSPPQISWLVAKGPEASARALLQTSAYLRHRQRLDLAQVAVARFELDALKLALHEAGESADRLGLLLLPIRGAEAATVVAGWLRHLGSARLWARLWLARHAETAARALIPAAAGKPGRTRQNAEDALRHLAAGGHAPMISRTASTYGSAAHEVITDLLANREPPARKAKLPAWPRPALRLTDGGTMPEQDVTALIEALRRSRLAEAPEPAPGDPDRPLVVESSAAAQPVVAPADPVAEKLIAACDRSSLAEFGRALLDGWLVDMPAAEAWVVLAQAHVGDDSTMDMLAPLVRSWPAKSRWARAIDGLAVLATVGTDVSLRHLLAIEENMVGGPTNERALVYLTQAAGARELSVTQLADRLAVTHGLDTAVTIDYGPRAFTVVADEHLDVRVVDASGRLLARPPKPGVRDTNPGAYAQFLGFKKQLRATAAAQIARLERDMLAHRTRPARDFPAILGHPVLGPIARRLLWGEYDGERKLLRAVRIAEDGSFADRHDTSALVAGDAPLGIVHPTELGAELANWAQIFADYQILQPFPQVHRPAVTLTEEQRAATSLPGFGLPTDSVLRMLSVRWHGNAFHGPRRPNVHTQLAREMAGGMTLLIELEPGVTTTAYNTADRQLITEIWADDSGSDHWQLARHTPMGACDPAALSELLVELYALRS